MTEQDNADRRQLWLEAKRIMWSECPIHGLGESAQCPGCHGALRRRVECAIAPERPALHGWTPEDDVAFRRAVGESWG